MSVGGGEDEDGTQSRAWHILNTKILSVFCDNYCTQALGLGLSNFPIS